MKDKQKPVFSFGEKGLYDKWYSHLDGVKIKCDEKTIDHLWWQWLMNPTAKRDDDNKYVIFKVTEPPIYLK